MKSILDYKNMVVAMTTQGIDIKAALDAAELVLFGMDGEKENTKTQTSGPDKVDIVRLPVIKESSRVGSPANRINRLADQTDLARRLGVTTNHFNKLLHKAGYLRREILQNKELSSSVRNSSTWRLTKAGKLYGEEYTHVRYKDGAPAVYRHKWDERIIRLLVTK